MSVCVCMRVCKVNVCAYVYMRVMCVCVCVNGEERENKSKGIYRYVCIHKLTQRNLDNQDLPDVYDIMPTL
jgi:hypothetical protein